MFEHENWCVSAVFCKYRFKPDQIYKHKIGQYKRALSFVYLYPSVLSHIFFMAIDMNGLSSIHCI